MFKSNYTDMEMMFQDYYGMMGGFIGVIIGAVIVSLVISVALMVWVYRDSQKRNMNAAVWLLIVFVAGCCGCVIYLMVREPMQPQAPLYQQTPGPPPQRAPATTGSQIFCPSCGIPLSTDATFCTGCGSKIR